MNKETWMPVVGFEEFYEVSDEGQVRSIPRRDRLGRSQGGKIRSARKDGRTAHLRVDLFNGERSPSGKRGKAHHRLVHRLVLEAFVGPCPEGMEACHWDGDPTNNRLENLRWDTRSENHRDAARHGTHFSTQKERCPWGHKLTEENCTKSSLRSGRRNCLACNRGRAYCLKKDTSESNVRLISDLYYDVIMGVAPMDKARRAALADNLV